VVSLIDFANIVVVCGKKGVEIVKFCVEEILLAVDLEVFF